MSTQNIENMKLETHDLKDVEIFETGIWKGEKYDEQSLDDMVTHFQNRVAEPYINIDHSDRATDQFKDALKAISLGFVSNLRRSGNKLIADFKQLPKTVAELIQAGALKKRSIELYKRYKHANGVLYNNVLGAVTFHGANGHPAISTLADVVALYKNTNAISGESQTDENVRVVLKNSDRFTKKENAMSEITIQKGEYENLVAFKAKAEAADKSIGDIRGELEATVKEYEAFKNKMLSTEKELSEAKDKLEKEIAKFKAEKQSAMDKEAVYYVSAQIEAGKVKPASKDLYIEQYKSFQSDENKLKVFKDDIESREVLIFKGAIESSTEKTDADIEKAIEIKMKNGVDFEKARAEVFAEAAARG